MPRFRLRTLLVAFVVLSFLLLLVKIYRDFSRQLKAEYNAAQVIRDVTQYVQAQQGRWPASWNDIPNGAFARQYVIIRFDVTPAELLDDPALMQSAIRPISGEYLTYPHAERQLNELREILARFYGRPSIGPVNP